MVYVWVSLCVCMCMFESMSVYVCVCVCVLIYLPLSLSISPFLSQNAYICTKKIEKQTILNVMSLYDVKSTLKRFGFNKPSSGLKMLKNLLEQQLTFYQNNRREESIYKERKTYNRSVGVLFWKKSRDWYWQWLLKCVEFPSPDEDLVKPKRLDVDSTSQ